MAANTMSLDLKKYGQDAGKIAAFVRSSLKTAGLDDDLATRYAVLCAEMYYYIVGDSETAAALKAAKDGREVWKDSNLVFAAAPYVERANALGLTSAKAFSWSTSAGVLQVFVDRFEAMAQKMGIELDECSLAVAKLSLDIAAAGIGSVTAVSGWGLVLAGMGVIGTARDGYVVGQCLLRAVPR